MTNISDTLAALSEPCPACGALPCDWVDNPHRTGQLVPVPSVERVARLRQAAVLLLNHAEGCAVNHYGEDFAVHGMPGWLADCRADIEAATAVIAAMQEGRDG